MLSAGIQILTKNSNNLENTVLILFKTVFFFGIKIDYKLHFLKYTPILFTTFYTIS